MCVPALIPIAGAVALGAGTVAISRALRSGQTAQPRIPAQPPRLPDEAVRLARADELSKRRRASGRSSTILTGPSGLTDTASTTGNVLLGQ